MTELVTNFDDAVGLFGTCGGSTWRELYYIQLAKEGIPFFDPQISVETHGRGWCEADIENEVHHLEQNPVLMFKVTGETTGLMSLVHLVHDNEAALDVIRASYAIFRTKCRNVELRAAL